MYPAKKKEEEVGVHPRKRRRWGVHPAEKEEEMCECIPEKKKEQQEQRMRGEILDKKEMCKRIPQKKGMRGCLLEKRGTGRVCPVKNKKKG